jgi:hypothetical protein
VAGDFAKVNDRGPQKMTVSGSINAGDIGLVKSKAGTALP